MKTPIPLNAVTLQAVANTYSTKVTVLTPDGSQYIIQPYTPQTSMAQLHLGHIVGGHMVIYLQCKFTYFANTLQYCNNFLMFFLKLINLFINISVYNDMPILVTYILKLSIIIAAIKSYHSHSSYTNQLHTWSLY